MSPSAWAQGWAQDAGLKVWFSEETDSTNRVAKDDPSSLTAPDLPVPPETVTSPSLYLTNSQTAGRGRGSHTWTTPQGALLSSWAFALNQVPQPIFPPLAGLALFEAAIATWPSVAFSLKAPNDLYIGREKTAGILIEVVDQGPLKRAVVGLGLNVHEAPKNVEAATCLKTHIPHLTESDFKIFLTNWRTRLEAYLALGLESELGREQRKRLTDALNLYPLLEAPILNVDPQGNRVTPSGTVSW